MFSKINLIQLIRIQRKCQIFAIRNHLSTAAAATATTASDSSASSGPILKPSETNPKILKIVNEIEKLTLLEVAELTKTLKEKLNIPDSSMMSFASLPGGMMPGAGAGGKTEEDDEQSGKTVQTAFAVKITKFDDGKKVALIKEVKNLVEGLNLVQAKKFVESVPQIVKNNCSKEEAEKLKKLLESVGATVSID